MSKKENINNKNNNSYFGRDYWQELWFRTTTRNEKRTYFIPIFLGFIFILIMFFTVFDLNFVNTKGIIGYDKNILSLSAWKDNVIRFPSVNHLEGVGAAAKTLLLIGTPISIFAAYNRIGQLKQDYFFSVLCNLIIGIGLILSIQSSAMVLSSIQNVFVYLMFSSIGLAISLNKKNTGTNVERPEEKFISQSFWVALASLIIGLIVFGLLLIVLMGGSTSKLDTPKHKAMASLLLISIGFAIAGISTMYFAKWKFTFVPWQISNIFGLIYFIWVSFESGEVSAKDSFVGGTQLWGIVVITMSYIFLDAIAMFRWMRKSKEDEILDKKLKK
ncbi:MAG: hypothetical protein K4H23_04575 [Mollicutes bacterium PWAP]|nr:hypothetical protein [Mollicutes bacterium PWAP]